MAGPPFVTDDPVPVAYKGWEINFAFTDTAVRGGSAIALPGIDANYGVFPGVQLHVQPQFAMSATPQSTQAGIGDTQFGIKLRLLDEDKASWLPMVSVYPIFTAPTGNALRGLGVGTGRLFLPVWVTKTLGKWSLDCGAGYSIDPGGNNLNAWFAGALLQYQFTPKLQLGGEVFLQTAQTRDTPNAPGFNLGGSYNITDAYHLLFSAGQGITHVSATNRFSVYLGLQVEF